jgi:hypothetical protein
MTDLSPANPPNRFNTPCTVEVYHHHNTSRYMGFADVQLAYQWIESRLQNFNDRHIRMFPDVCAKLDYEYTKNGLHGYVIVGSCPDVQYCLYYGQLRI